MMYFAFPPHEKKKTKRTVSHISLSLSGWGFDIDEGLRNEIFLSVASGIYRAQYRALRSLVIGLSFSRDFPHVCPVTSISIQISKSLI